MSSLHDALDDARNDLSIEAEKSADSIEDQVGQTVDSFIDGAMKDPEDVPLIVDPSDTLKTANSRLAKNAAILFEAHAAEAVRTLAQEGQQVMEDTTKIINKLIELGRFVAKQRISIETAERASEHYFEALKLQGKRAENRNKAIAYRKAQAALQTARSLLFAGLRAALSLGTQAALGYMTGVRST